MSRFQEVRLSPSSFCHGRTATANHAGAIALFLLSFAAVLPARPAAAQSLSGTVSPRQVSYTGTLGYTASASGLDPSTTRYAFFRRRPGGTWIPDVNAPPWQASSSYDWSPTLSDVGTWETYIWVKDGNTPANANTYGYAAGLNTLPIEVVGPPTAAGPTTVSCDYTAWDECWVTGDFVVSASAASGGLGSITYNICRSNDTTGWGGCDVNLTLSGGTSTLVSGGNLPADGFRRAYYFLARDSAGAFSGWNSPTYVRVDRYAPSVSASNASNVWYSSRTATVFASDAGSGLQAVRYSWNAALDAGCNLGTPISSGATLTAPAGDNLLYLCGRDNTGRVGQWSGQYRVAPMSVGGSVSPARGSYLNSFTWTVSSGGGTPATTRYAFFRRRPGGTWLPDVFNPPWQASNVYSWTPTLADVGMWETYVWVKDGDTPAGANIYGYAAGTGTGTIEVVGPPAAPGPTTVGCAYYNSSTADCWVAGDFTASATASTGGMGSLVYQICRSNDTAGWGGCEINLTLSGGTSLLISGTHLASDGFRRAYYFLARDSAGALGAWNSPAFVRVDRYAPAVSASNASPDWFSSRTATVSASDVTGGAGANSGVLETRYAWNSPLDAACTLGTVVASGTTLTAPVGDNLLYLCVKDNVGRVGQWSGSYRVAAPLTLTGSVTPSRGSYLGTFTYTASASGGTPATTQYAFFRRRPGGIWIPDVNAPTWQAGNVYSWHPTLADVGTWETYIWAKDGNTPANANTYGYAAGVGSGSIEVVGPPAAPGPTTVGCAYSVADDCWVAGDFTASATASTGGMGSLVYQICRSNDTAGWGGCEVNLTLSGGTSILVSATDLAGDGFRRAYYFLARDSAGALSGWNVPRFVRVDRYAPVASATNASNLWFSSRTATLSASDIGSGVQAVRYSWNAALDAGCTTGTASTAGTTLTAPAGDNVLYLCARDNVGRIGQWSGQYRISPMTLTGSVSPARASYLGTFTYTASASGGTPATTRYAFFRRRAGGNWIPDVNSPSWQAGNTFSWTPVQADVGTWETYIWVKDGDTPANANTYGYAVGAGSGSIEVVGPPTAPGPTTVSCAYSVAATGDCWVAGDFTASVTASTGGMGSLAYQICRSNDSAGGFAGCEWNLTLTGGTSILVSGTDLPADGFRRAYYFLAKDAAGALSDWNTPRFVRVDRYAPAVGASNASDLWFSSRTATVAAGDDGGAGGAGANSGLLAVRYSWNAALDAGCTTGTATAAGATLTAPVGDNLLYLCARDNVSRVTQWNGRYRVTAALSLTGTVSPTRASYLNTFTWTASASGGNPSTIRYAFFRRRPAGAWIPDVNNPNWQAGNSYTWGPTAADAGPWETYIWVKDGDTPANANTHGYAAGVGSGSIEVVGPPTAPGPTTVACAYSAADDCWVAGDFTASVTASTGGMGSLTYQICRSNDSPGGFAGCEANLTLTGGASILVSGVDLPADGFRRAYFFQAKDAAGAWSGWNVPRYVRVDRYVPAVSATNASEEWFTSRTATVSASDAGGGAGANSGLQTVRFSWITPVDAGCTTGAVTSPGATLNAPAGDNLLYLCARDNVGRVAQWSGRYRVQAAPAPEVTAVTPMVIQQGSQVTVTVTGAHLQGATVYIATEPADDVSVVPVPVGGIGAPTRPGDPGDVGILDRVFPTATVLGVNAEGTALTVQIDAQEPGIDGFYNLAVQTPGGQTAGQLRVVGTEPVVDVFTPSQPVSGNIHVFMLAGANLQGAEVVPVDSSVKVLEIDNSNDATLMGLLYIDSNALSGPTELRVRRPSGQILSLSMEIVGSLAATTLKTTKVDIPGKSNRPDVPDVLLQQPISPYFLAHPEFMARGRLAQAGAGKRSANDKAFIFCLSASAGQRYSYTKIFLSLTNLADKPLTKEVLNRLVPGERLNFNSLTVAASVSVEYLFLFRVCNGVITDLFICLRGSVSYTIPFFDGWKIDFDLCAGNRGRTTSISANGLISRHEWSTSNSCVTVVDNDPESQSGRRSSEIAVDCCTPADIHLHTTGIAFDQAFDAQGTVAAVHPENCQQPSPPALRLLLDVDGNNLSDDADHVYLPGELDDSARYVPCSPLGSGVAPPGDGVPPNQLPQKVSIYAAYVQTLADGKLKIVAPPADVRSVEIELQNTSKLNGVATNFPPDQGGGTGSTFQDPDFWIGAGGATPASKDQTVTASFGSPEAPGRLAVATLFCNDYGGRTSMHVRPAAGTFTPLVTLPATNFNAGGGLPSVGWTAVNNEVVQTAALQDNTDDDAIPSGAGVGDGLSAFSEYRGMVINNRHYRLNPAKKDVFVVWDSAFPDVGIKQLGVVMHRPQMGEVYQSAGVLSVNIQGMAMSADTDPVVAVALVNDSTSHLPPYNPNDPDSTRLGFTRGKVLQRGQATVTSTMYTLRISDYRDRYPQRLSLAGTIDWVFSHEIGHALDICHREENEQGNPIPDPNSPECNSRTLDPRSSLPFGVFFMHSGAVFEHVGKSTDARVGPAKTYNANSLAQIKLK